MITRNKIKFYSQLQQKKYRKLNQIFIAEGIKNITELIKSNIIPESIIISKNKNQLILHEIIKKKIVNKERKWKIINSKI